MAQDTGCQQQVILPARFIQGMAHFYTQKCCRYYIEQIEPKSPVKEQEFKPCQCAAGYDSGPRDRAGQLKNIKTEQTKKKRLFKDNERPQIEQKESDTQRIK